MQVDNNWYWNQQLKQHDITVSTLTILHSQMKVNSVTYFTQYPEVYVLVQKLKIHVKT